MDDLAAHRFLKALPPVGLIAESFRNGHDCWLEVPDDARAKTLARRRLREAGKLVGRKVQTHGARAEFGQRLS